MGGRVRCSHRTDRPELCGTLMFERLHLHQVLALYRLLLSDVRVIAAL